MGDTSTPLGPLERANPTIQFLEYRMMDKIQKTSSSPSLEPFRI
jgi:hypothetical protein